MVNVWLIETPKRLKQKGLVVAFKGRTKDITQGRA